MWHTGFKRWPPLLLVPPGPTCPSGALPSGLLPPHLLSQGWLQGPGKLARRVPCSPHTLALISLKDLSHLPALEPVPRRCLPSPEPSKDPLQLSCPGQPQGHLLPAPLEAPAPPHPSLTHRAHVQAPISRVLLGGSGAGARAMAPRVPKGPGSRGRPHHCFSPRDCRSQGREISASHHSA